MTDRTPTASSDPAGTDRSIQERLFPDMTCFGCGPANAQGLRLRSFPEGESVVAEFAPWPEHDNGLGFLNGGIIATLLDCHSAAAVLLEADRRGWEGPSGSPLAFVTAGLDLRFVRPSPLDAICELRATLTSAEEDQVVALSELWFDGKVRASATAVWKRWRPRTGASAITHGGQ